MKPKLAWMKEEILADCDHASRIRHEGTLFHGGLDERGNYIPPRSRHRLDAIAAWSTQLDDAGHRTQVVFPDQVARAFFPTVEQSKLLLRHGARGAMTRILTLIGITEGFGNDGIKIMPRLDLQRHFRRVGLTAADAVQRLLDQFVHRRQSATVGERSLAKHFRVTGLAYFLTYSDAFRTIGIFFLCCVPLLLLFNKARAPVSTALPIE